MVVGHYIKSIKLKNNIQENIVAKTNDNDVNNWEYFSSNLLPKKAQYKKPIKGKKTIK